MPIQYMGSKKRVMGNILNIIPNGVKSIIDVCSGSGQVSLSLANHKYDVAANDILLFSNTLVDGYLNSTLFNISNLSLLLTEANSNTNLDKYKSHWIVELYSKRSKFLYLSNALKCAYLYEHINSNLAMISLIEAISVRLNSQGHHNSFYTDWHIEATFPIYFEMPDYILKDSISKVYNIDLTKFILPTQNYDLTYVDPPYCSRSYETYYHLYETLVQTKKNIHYIDDVVNKINMPKSIKDNKPNLFYSKNNAEAAFDKLLSNIKSKYVLISYSDNGIIPIDNLINMAKKYGTVSGNKIELFHYSKYINEYLILVER